MARVTLDGVKAVRLVEALRRVGRTHLNFVLNFRTLRRPVLVVDTHLARVPGRLGLDGDASGLSNGGDDGDGRLG